MVVSSGFMDHVLTYDRSEVYLRANGLIQATAQPINNTLNRQQPVSCDTILTLKNTVI